MDGAVWDVDEVNVQPIDVHDALALVCARERERTARQPSKALQGTSRARKAGFSGVQQRR